MAIEPLAIGVCSWSLQVTNMPELKGFMDRLGIDVVQIACGDPHHASWDEGDAMPAAAKAAGFRMVEPCSAFPVRTTPPRRRSKSPAASAIPPRGLNGWSGSMGLFRTQSARAVGHHAARRFHSGSRLA